MWLIEHNGHRYDLPFEFNKFSPGYKGKLPDEVMIHIDELQFVRRFGSQAVWTSGKGPYLLLAYCRELTITRHQTLEAAVKNKRLLDSDACGGCCSNIHVIAYADPANGFKAAEKKGITDYIAEHNLQPNGEASVVK